MIDPRQSLQILFIDCRASTLEKRTAVPLYTIPALLFQARPSRSVVRRIDDDIRTLCARLLVTKNDKEVRSIITELRTALRIQIGRLRTHLAQYPFVVDRRARQIPAPDAPRGMESAPKISRAQSEPAATETPPAKLGRNSRNQI